MFQQINANAGYFRSRKSKFVLEAVGDSERHLYMEVSAEYDQAGRMTSSKIYLV